MEVSMKITVAIPVYNEEKYIASCLESIMRGTRLPDEILVADGGSVDRTREIARELGATVIPNPRKNAASGRNEWIKRAMSSITDVSTGLLSKRSKSILLNDALDCLRLLDKAFEDTDELSKITFNVNEFMLNEMRKDVQ
jgi:glycosyltransferase involved in cell wall biosynthesis